VAGAVGTSGEALTSAVVAILAEALTSEAARSVRRASVVASLGARESVAALLRGRASVVAWPAPRALAGAAPSAVDSPEVIS
jgi:hypothetical protein